MNKQDVVNTIYQHYAENYDMRTAVEALEFLGVSADEIEHADLCYQETLGDPDERAHCKCGHMKKDHAHFTPFICLVDGCDCGDFAYL